MRIIAGTRKGTKLSEFEGSSVRPTTDRVKESVFNLIQDYVSGARVLDLFCGSGSLSLEALSRGADFAVCVDKDARSAELIRKNISLVRFEDRCLVINKSCFDYMNGTDESFDIIFLDPPYNKGFIEPVMNMIRDKGLLNDGGIIVLESDSTDCHGEKCGFDVLKERKYGRTYITVYALKGVR